MNTAKEKLQEIIDIINKKFPDDPDLKGFLGISRSIIIMILEQSQIQIVKLKEFDNHFETIVLKRELAELFAKIKGNLKKDFNLINAGSFNSILRMIAEVKRGVNATYYSVVNEANVRTEVELLHIKSDLAALLADTEELKKVKKEIIDLRTITVQAVDASVNEVSALKTSASSAINNAITEVDGLKQNTVTGINSFYDQTKGIKEKADTLFSDLIEREKTTTQNSQKIEEYVTAIEKKNSSIETISTNIIQWNLDIGKANNDITASQKLNTEIIEQSKFLLSASESIREKITGKPDDKGGVSGGLLQDTEKLKGELVSFLEKQTKKYETQFKEIEAMLPGAASVGLAKAYQEQKESYRKPLNRWSWVFVSTLIVMTAFSAFVIYEQFQNSPIKSLNEALTALFRYLPFYVPTIWLVAYASKQQSQVKRLQQEYAFKETNAKSFQGHKEQIEKLIKEGGADKQLLANLVAQMVIITGQNPSSTLDHHTHNDSPPMFKLVEKMFFWKKKPEETAKTVAEDLSELTNKN